MEKKDALVIVLQSGGAFAAKEQLMRIAEEEGDQGLVRIVALLSGAELTQLTTDSDLTCPSLVHGLLTPEKFAEVFRRVGTKWKEAAEPTCRPETLRSFQEELNQFFSAHIILTDDLQRRIELLKAVLNNRLGVEALVFAVINEKEFHEFMEGGGHAASLGDWQEVVDIVATYLPEQWAEFKAIATEVLSGRDLHSFVQGCAEDIYGMAVEASGAAPEEAREKEPELFTPLP